MTFSLLEVDDPDGVVAELGNEEPLPRQINRHVIDSAAHFAERNFGFELQRLVCELADQPRPTVSPPRSISKLRDLETWP